MQPLKGNSFLYNPNWLDRDVLIETFVVRREKLLLIRDDLQNTDLKKPIQHFLIHGMRGMGKTTLLLRLNYEIQNDDALSSKLVPILFDEEQYSVRKLDRLWELAIDQVVAWDATAAKIYRHFIETDQTKETALNALLTYLKGCGKQAVLFLENLGELLSRMGARDEKRLREILMSTPYIRLIGSTAQFTVKHSGYHAPFFEFFKIVRLESLSSNETKTLLAALGRFFNEEHLHQMVLQYPNRVEAMRRLTGGSPRTMVMLCEVLSDSWTSELVQHLELCIDRVTPYYKLRMDSLTPQHQDIINTLARAWDAIPTKEVAARVDLPSAQVSAQLKQLADNGLITQVRTKGRNAFYRISERFFNIWYLMRNARKEEGKRVLWLVRFLEEWCDPTSLEDSANQLLETLTKTDFSTDHAFMLAEALVRTGKLSLQLQHDLVLATRNALIGRAPHLIKDLSSSDLELVKEAHTLIKNKRHKQALRVLRNTHNENGRMAWCIALCYGCLGKEEQAITHLEKAVNLGETGATLHLAYCYSQTEQIEKAETLLKSAVQRGNHEASFHLGLLLEEELDTEQAFQFYRKALEQNISGAANNLGLLCAKKGPYEHRQKAEAYLLRATEDKHSMGRLNLAFYLLSEEDFAGAHKAVTQVLAKGLREEEFTLIGRYLELLMIRQMYHTAWEIMQTPRLNLTEVLKPIYYALMFFMNESRPGEYLRMGPELSETTEEIVQRIQKGQELVFSNRTMTPKKEETGE